MKSKNDVAQFSRRWGLQSGLRASAVVALSVALVTSGIAQSHSAVFPDLIQLQADFGSEGIAAGPEHTFYVGSWTAPALGQILVGDLRTGSLPCSSPRDDPRSG